MLSFSLHCTPKEAIIERITLYAALIQFFDRNSNTTQVSFIMNTKILATVYIAVIVGLSTFVRCLH